MFSLLPCPVSAPLSCRIHPRRRLPNNPSTSSRAVRVTRSALVPASLCNSGGDGNLPSGDGGYGNLFSGGGGDYDNLSSGGGGGGGYDNLFSGGGSGYDHLFSGGGGSDGYGKLFSGGGGGDDDYGKLFSVGGGSAGSEDEGGGDGDDASVNRREVLFVPSQLDQKLKILPPNLDSVMEAFRHAPDHIVQRLLQFPGSKEHLLADDHSLPKLAVDGFFRMIIKDNLECPPVSDFSNSTGATYPVEAEADHSNGNNHAQYEASMVTRTATAGVIDNLSTLLMNNSENEKKNKAIVAFLFTIVDKKPILLALIIGGLVYSHGPTPLLWISEDWMQVLFAGGVISNISSIILAGSASYFKEIQSPDHPGFVVCSMIVFWELLFSLLLICIILLGFERSSKCVIWSVGVFLLLSLVLVWVAFQRQPMVVWLKWTKNALEWMLKWAKNAFEWMRAKISELRLIDESLPQICTEV